MTIPRSLPPSTLERLAVTNTRMSPGAAGGVSRHVRRPDTSSVNSQARAGVAVVEHGDDPNVDRPDALWVLWVGAATPNNKVDFDGWFAHNVTA